MSIIVSRGGQINGAGDDRAMYLKVFAGEVITTFRRKTVFAERSRLRQISSGKSAQFPALGTATASYHTPGTRLQGQKIQGAERNIALDDQLVADVFIPDIDEAMSHYDVRGEYSFQLGDALAQQYDQNLAQVGYLAARASATVSGGNGGGSVTDADADTNGTSLAASVFDAMQLLDEKDVPEDERFSFVAPAQYYNLVETDKLLNRDFGGMPGVYSEGTLLRVAGTTLVKTNNLPNGSNVTTGPSTYQGDFSNSVALIMNRQAIGTVRLLSMNVETKWMLEYLSWLTVARYAVGHGILRPECAVEIKTA